MVCRAEVFLGRPSANDQPFQQYKEQLGVTRYYTFAEAGYVDGAMDKEILERVKEGEIKQERLWLI